MNRIKLILLTIVLSFLAGCTTQQIDQLLKKIPDASSGVEVTSQEAQEAPQDVVEASSSSSEPSFEQESTDSQSLQVTQIKPEKVCFRRLQGKIAYNYKGNKRWNPSNIKRLCNNTTRGREPAKCFKRVMHGGIYWGGSTKWQWKNAIDLCEGTNNARKTIRCFQKRTHVANNWKKAIRACETG